MAINLPDIRTATQDYLENSVAMTVTPPVPDVPLTINPAEEFTFDVRARNTGGVRLIGVLGAVTLGGGGGKYSIITLLMMAIGRPVEV